MKEFKKFIIIMASTAEPSHYMTYEKREMFFYKKKKGLERY